MLSRVRARLRYRPRKRLEVSGTERNTEALGMLQHHTATPGKSCIPTRAEQHTVRSRDVELATTTLTKCNQPIEGIELLGTAGGIDFWSNLKRFTVKKPKKTNPRSSGELSMLLSSLSGKPRETYA